LKRAVVALLFAALLASCATTPKAPPLTAPAWEMVPAGIAGAICQRLQSDRFSDSLVMVKVTQPIVTSASLAALFPMQRRPLELKVPPTRAIPIETAGGSCAWKMIDAADRERYLDSVVVELSAPLLNPAKAKEAGLFARVSTGGAYEWYWLALRSDAGAWVLSGMMPIGL
jgi:hypothetical protein